MKILFLLAALPLLAAAPEASETPRSGAANPPRPITGIGGKECPNARARQALTPRRAEPQRLIDLPPARLELTVLREIDGCAIPAVLREGIGGNPAIQDGSEPNRR